MTATDDLSEIVGALESLLTRFTRTRDALFLTTELQAEFKRLVTEAKSILDDELEAGQSRTVQSHREPVLVPVQIFAQYNVVAVHLGLRTAHFRTPVNDIQSFSVVFDAQLVR